MPTSTFVTQGEGWGTSVIGYTTFTGKKGPGEQERDDPLNVGPTQIEHVDWRRRSKNRIYGQEKEILEAGFAVTNENGKVTCIRTEKESRGPRRERYFHERGQWKKEQSQLET